MSLYLNQLFTIFIILFIYGLVGQNEGHKSESSDGFDYGQNSELVSRVSYALNTEKLIELSIFEMQLYSKFKSYYIKVADNYPKKLKLRALLRYLQDFEQSSLMAYRNSLEITNITENAKIISTNPIFIYKMIKRCAGDLVNLVAELKGFSEIIQDIFNNMKDLDRSISVPTPDDVEDALEGLLRIHSVYDLQLDLFTQGVIGNFKTEATLNGQDCMDIGRYALETKKYALAIEWLEIGMINNVTSPGDYYGLKGDIAKSLTTAKILHDNEWDDWKHESVMRNLLLKNKKEEPLGLISNQNRRRKFLENQDSLFNIKVSEKSYKERTKMSKLIRESLVGDSRKEKVASELVSHAICDGMNFQTEEEKLGLKCWLETKSHPYWKINPLKIELLHSNPDLIQLYDFVGDKMIAKLVDFSVPSLKRSGVLDISGFRTEFSYSRTSLNTWIYDSPFLESLHKKIEFATGLEVRKPGAGQALQFVDYSALGSHYDVHHDGMKDEQLTREHGDRISTFMIYLNDVKMGGYTAFPMLGTATKPIKGSAVLWYNNYRNGTGDMRTSHCGCPVVLGRKQIANKWILTHENMFKKPCALNCNS